MTKAFPFILYPDPRLNAVSAPRCLDADLVAAGAALLDAAREHRAYGLAAAHIGKIEPVVVVSVGPAETRDYRVMFNPQIVQTGGAAVSGSEGSVSLPGIEVAIVRPQDAVIAYDDDQGIGQTLALEGFPARVAQHEIDQMNGVFFLAHLSRLKRDAAIRRYLKLRRDEK